MSDSENNLEHLMPDEPIEEIISTYYTEDFPGGVHVVANIFPMPTDEEFDNLCKSIKKDGLEVPLIRDPKTLSLVDGRSRLLACFVVMQELRIVDSIVQNLLNQSIRLNLDRRHLSQGQKACIGQNVLELLEAEAKERQKAALKQGNKTKHSQSSIRTNSSEPRTTKLESSKSSQQAADTVGVGQTSIKQAKNLKQYAPEEFNKVLSGDKSLNAATKDAEPAIRQAKKEEKQSAAPKEQPKMVPILNVDGRIADYPKPKQPKFNGTNDNVSWAKWTWNPVTGCNHGCPFCYAREIAHMPKMKASYPFGFEPSLREYQLPAPANTPYPNDFEDPRNNRVFVCSMADLFGKWVPDEWIQKVFSACMAAPEWEYLFLTKWPNRYKMLETLPKAWFGASIIQQSDVARVEKAMQSFETSGVKWISLEPMLEPIAFNDLSWCDIVVIGGQTSTRQPDGTVISEKPVPFDWVVDVVNQCRNFKVPYYLKPNLAEKPGMVLPTPEPRSTSPMGTVHQLIPGTKKA